MRPAVQIRTGYPGTGQVSLGLIGYPLSHSLSPRVHHAALQGSGLDGEYNLYPIPPLPEGESQLEGLLDQVREGTIQGLNVTIPHKENVLPRLERLTHSARAIGAVNTIYLQEGRLWGDNTDAPGFWADIQQLVAGHPGVRSALLLGAGGSARAVTYALLTRGYHVTLAARRIDQAAALTSQFASISSRCAAVPWEDIRLHTERVSLVVNTTPVGMHPKPWHSPWPGEVPLPEDCAVYDLVYNPSTTRLIQQAWLNGNPASTGIGMLVEQAALSFERWTGRDAPRGQMFAAIADFGKE